MDRLVGEVGAVTDGDYTRALTAHHTRELTTQADAVGHMRDQLSARTRRAVADKPI